MSFKALNNREKEKAERSYIHSHTTKHLTLLTKGKRSQSALEYMMTYGWAILIIVIVAVILYSMGIFNPSSSVSSTVTGFSGLGSVTAQCTANGVLRISIGDSTGNLINITGITAKDPAITKTSTFKPNSTVDPNPMIKSGSSYIFSVPDICPSAGTHYAITVAVNYTEPGQPLPGPYQSLGSITGTSTSTVLPPYVAYFTRADYINTRTKPFQNQSFSIVFWAYLYNTSSGSSSDQHFIFDMSQNYECPGSSSSIDWLDIRGTSFHTVGWCSDLYEAATPDTWYLLSWTYNKSGKTQTFYIDGGSPTSDSWYVLNPQGQLYLGSTGGVSLHGFLTNFQIYNTTLTQTQLSAIYNEGLDYKPITNAVIADFWALNGTVNNYANPSASSTNVGVVFTSDYPTTGLP